MVREARGERGKTSGREIHITEGREREPKTAGEGKERLEREERERERQRQGEREKRGERGQQPPTQLSPI